MTGTIKKFDVISYNPLTKSVYVVGSYKLLRSAFKSLKTYSNTVILVYSDPRTVYIYDNSTGEVIGLRHLNV
jgi:hypothetical protein